MNLHNESGDVYKFSAFFRRIASSKDANLCCLVLDVDSPGGSPAEAEAMVCEIVAR